MKIDLSKRCDFALLDVRTKKANAEINAIRKAGKYIKVVITGYIMDQDWGDYDGASIEQGIDVTSVKSTVVNVLPKKVYPHRKQLIATLS